MAKSYTVKEDANGNRVSIVRNNEDGTKTELDSNFAPIASTNTSNKISTSSRSNTSTSSVDRTSDYSDYVKQLTNAQYKAQANDLARARDKALANYDKQEVETRENAQANRNQVSTNSQLAQRKLNDYLASAGLQNSGTSAQAKITSNGALQRNLGNIDNTEYKAINDLNTARTQARNDYEYGLQQARAQADITGLQNFLAYKSNMDNLAQQQAFSAEQAELQRQYALEQANQQRAWALEDMLKQREWQQEDTRNSVMSYTDPLTGQQYYLPASTVAQLNSASYQNQLDRQQQMAMLNARSSSSGSSKKSSSDEYLSEYLDNGEEYAIPDEWYKDDTKEEKKNALGTLVQNAYVANQDKVKNIANISKNISNLANTVVNKSKEYAKDFAVKKITDILVNPLSSNKKTTKKK